MFSVYLGRYVKVDISSGYYYEGKILDVGEDFLMMIDKRGKNVTIAISDILSVREVSNG